METPKPAEKSPEESMKDKISNDLKKEFKEIIEKHWDGREYIDEKIKTWVNNILIEAKEYFIKKYPDYFFV